MWREYYKLPLEMDDYCSIITWTADKQRAFDWCAGVQPHQEKRQELLDIINSDSIISEHISDPFIKYSFYRSGEYIYSEHPVFNGSPVMHIRGWGRLIGTGGFNLDQETAKQIQNAFGDFIVNQLNKYVKKS